MHKRPKSTYRPVPNDGGAPCLGKVRYETKASAKKAVARLRSQGSVAKLRTFKCAVCGFYHVGSYMSGTSRATLRQRRLARADGSFGESVL